MQVCTTLPALRDSKLNIIGLVRVTPDTVKLIIKRGLSLALKERHPSLKLEATWANQGCAGNLLLKKQTRFHCSESAEDNLENLMQSKAMKQLHRQVV